jgi:hypothetical protein
MYMIKEVNLIYRMRLYSLEGLDFAFKIIMVFHIIMLFLNVT